MERHSAKEFWVYGDLRNERFFGFSLNVLAKAKKLAQSTSETGKVAMILIEYSALSNSEIPAGSGACISIDEASKACIAHGADFVYILEAPIPAEMRADVFGAILAKVVLERNPRLVMLALTDFGRELASRAARICNAGLIADCLDLRLEEGNVIASCPSWGGEILAEITFSKKNAIGFATVQPHAHRAEKTAKDPGTIKRIPVSWDGANRRPRLVSVVVETSAQNNLEEADTVVVGGAGLGNTDGFALVRELAAAMGGEVGATRPPVLHHWVDEGCMIGQTGKKIRPNLLVSVGTSGAVQYTAGIMESKKIVAVNRDPNSAIFQVADMGVVADAKTFLPLFTKKVKQVVMRKMADALCNGRPADTGEGFGAKMCKLREAHSWTKEALAEATGQTPEFIENVEKETFSPPVSFLLRLARALNVDPSTFLREEEKEMIRGQRSQSFIKRTRNYSYETLTPGAENDHLRAFMVTIESRQVHKPVEYKHEGEEFIYVMEGELEVTLGGKIHHLKKGESIHFNSEVPHKLKSLSSEDTRCLVVLYTV